jgi:hypothetical protein
VTSVVEPLVLVHTGAGMQFLTASRVPALEIHRNIQQKYEMEAFWQAGI